MCSFVNKFFQRTWNKGNRDPVDANQYGIRRFEIGSDGCDAYNIVTP